MGNYNLDEIKESLTIEQVMELVAELGGEPNIQNNIIISRTICHGGNSRKLYYYDNSHLFHCFTDCAESFDIFELVRKVKIRELDKDFSLPAAVDFVAKYFGYAPNNDINNFENNILQEDLTYFQNYDRIKNISLETQIVELKTYDGSFLKNLPHVIIEPWIKEGITKEVMDSAGICYDPKNCGIVIPHFNINNKLIGIRERTLIKENEQYGKYRPAYIGGKLYNHPLSFNLYNLNHSKENISRMEKVFVFEGEKSCLLYRSYFGNENDLSVAICGSSFINYQAWLLIQQGAKEIIICLDKQFQKTGDDEFKKLVKNLKGIHNKYGKYVTISYLFDKNNLLDYKDSPIDKSKEVFLKLYKNRVNLYNVPLV